MRRLAEHPTCRSRSRCRCTRPTTSSATTLVPLNHRYPIAAVVDAARDYAAIKGRRVTFEYACIEGVNDQPDQADRARRAAARTCGAVPT